MGGRSEQAARALRLQGEFAFRQQHYLDAARLFGDALAIYPEGDERCAVLYESVEARMMTSSLVADYDSLIPDLMTIVEKASSGEQKARALNFAGFLMRVQGKSQEAAKLYEQIVEQYPKSSYAKSAKGYVGVQTSTGNNSR